MTKQKSKATNKINKQKELELKKRKRRKKILIIVVLILLVVAIYIYLLNSEVFNIQDIKITGNKQLTEEQIYELSDIKFGDNIFSKVSIVTRVKLKENPYISDVKLKKIYPNKIELEIIEREKSFQIKTESGQYIYIDEQGYLLESSLDKLEIITIKGMEITEEKLNQIKRLEKNDLEKMENILQIQAEAKKIDIANRITKIQVKDNYILKLENEGVSINLGDASNLKNRMFYVKAILAKEAGISGTIHVEGNLDEGFSPYFSAN